MKQLDSSGMILEANGEIDSVISALSAAYEILNHKDNVAHEVGILHISINQLEATLKKLNTVGMNI
ncbi:hypothetical protein NUG10_003460 [Yersinia enterocolitica]|uniref:hypothetical protein n=1 Tax=Yersinia TaxID=629 RepID=UPI002AC6F0D5|nr:hypothetical protein [Yersinia enterocolitica]EKN3873766.1 hypothetical protein [Yersinia enterocolitica]HDL6761601.1 hypothetical protein [Yersinia enterocolitica]HDM8443864.1 hypothetical protein [Yersinia enterocolitica]HDM9021976.1 hypothetical protein [Yersinia enterocolitica]